MVRPGPIQGGAVHPYLDRRGGCAKTRPFRSHTSTPRSSQSCATPWKIVFQEQVIQVAMELGGYSAGEAEKGLRRAMSRKRSEEAIIAHRDRFIAGARRARVER